jgi:hypothetical protein
MQDFFMLWHFRRGFTAQRVKKKSFFLVNSYDITRGVRAVLVILGKAGSCSSLSLWNLADLDILKTQYLNSSTDLLSYYWSPNIERKMSRCVTSKRVKTLLWPTPGIEP